MKTIAMTDEQYRWFEESIAEMEGLYATPDEDVLHEYQYADDIARDVAEKLLGIMKAEK